MKVFISIVVLVVVAAALWFAVSSRGGNIASKGPDGQAAGITGEAGDGAPDEMGGAIGERPGLTGDADDDEEAEEGAAADDRPATEVYKSAEEALRAVKEAAADYDDLVLDQFTDLPANCTWCDNFYRSLKELLGSADLKADERSYYAELLAISGRVENIKALVDALGAAKNSEEANVYAEALELSTGGDDVARLLGEQLGSSNETLREASVAAITNQGSRLAAELLYKNTVDRGDPDGYYSAGIGLGELVPEPETLPYLQDLAMKRDAYSHLAVKSLLNSGLDGTKIVVDVLSNSKNPDFDREMLKGAKDHVAYDEEVVAYLKTVAESSQAPAVREFARDVISEFEQSEAEAEEDQDGDQVIPPLPPGALED